VIRIGLGCCDQLKNSKTPAFPRSTRSVLLQDSHRQKGGVSSERYYTPEAGSTQGADFQAAASATLEASAQADAGGEEYRL
jgi:hypothetical protein